MKSIVIKTYSAEESKSNIFRLHGDAAEIVRRHQRASGLHASYIISEIIRQTAELVSFEEGGNVDLS